MASGLCFVLLLCHVSLCTFFVAGSEPDNCGREPDVSLTCGLLYDVSWTSDLGMGLTLSVLPCQLDLSSGNMFPSLTSLLYVSVSVIGTFSVICMCAVPP